MPTEIHGDTPRDGEIDPAWYLDILRLRVEMGRTILVPDSSGHPGTGAPHGSCGVPKSMKGGEG